jgi:hypothetical protein
LARQTALFILHYQPIRLFTAPPATYVMSFRLIHEPSTSPSETRQKYGLARTSTVALRGVAICEWKIQDLLKGRPFTMPAPSRMVTS